MRVLLTSALAISAFAQTQPKIENAKLDTRAVSGSLEATFRTLVSSAVDPAWIGYSVPQVPGERSMCGTVALEGGREFVVLYRAAGGQVEKIRTYATDCTFDAGDLPLHWLTGVDGSQSALLLSSFVPPSTDSKNGKGGAWQIASSALSAIARHQDGAPALIDLARRPQISPQIKQEAVRWLGRSKDPRALKFFEEILAAR
ncbi:MAG TPA: hypothetical protein VNU44_23245 [Bryobacteraceae bacterium]|nr:hypothetical protein [Bryobacteraceae bacterium]